MFAKPCDGMGSVNHTGKSTECRAPGECTLALPGIELSVVPLEYAHQGALLQLKIADLKMGRLCGSAVRIFAGQKDRVKDGFGALDVGLALMSGGRANAIHQLRLPLGWL